MSKEIKSKYDLPGIGEGYFLEVSTYKSTTNGEVCTFATVFRDNGNGGVEHEIFHDFSKRVATHNVKRATEKALREAHQKAVANIGAVLTLVKEHYKK